MIIIRWTFPDPPRQLNQQLQPSHNNAGNHTKSPHTRVITAVNHLRDLSNSPQDVWNSSRHKLPLQPISRSLLEVELFISWVFPPDYFTPSTDLKSPHDSHTFFRAPHCHTYPSPNSCSCTHVLITYFARYTHVTHHPAPHICHFMSNPSHAAWYM